MDKDICKNCGEEIIFSTGGVYVTPEDWRHLDNGYTQCRKNKYETIAEPKGAAIIKEV